MKRGGTTMLRRSVAGGVCGTEWSTPFGKGRRHGTLMRHNEGYGGS